MLTQHWLRHHWRSRTATHRLDDGTALVAVCRCVWWRRLWFLVIGR